MHELGRLSPDAFDLTPRHSIVLVLDNIRSGLNVGSIFRTADAFAIERIILCGITPQPPHREILKTALGATETVAWSYLETAAEAVAGLLEQGYHVYPVEQTDKSIPLSELELRSGESHALIFGNEVEGVSDAVIQMLPESIEIPQWGTKHSLNVAVSAGIVVWHVVYARIKGNV